MAHIIVPEAEKLLDQEIPVLDKGFVRLVDYMGGDDRQNRPAGRGPDRLPPPPRAHLPL